MVQLPDALFCGGIHTDKVKVDVKLSAIGMVFGSAVASGGAALYETLAKVKLRPNTPARAAAWGALLGVNTMVRWRANQEHTEVVVGGPFAADFHDDDVN